MIYYPEEILKLIKYIEPWEIGAGIFKKDTPNEVLRAHEQLLEWNRRIMDGVQ